MQPLDDRRFTFLPGYESTHSRGFHWTIFDRDRARSRPSGTRSVLTPGKSGLPSVGCSLMHENLSNVHLPNEVGSQLHACASNFQLSHLSRLCAAWDVPYESISSDPSMALICMYQASMSQNSICNCCPFSRRGTYPPPYRVTFSESIVESKSPTTQY